MQVYSNLFRVFLTGIQKVWSYKRILADNKKDRAMSPMGRTWTRSSSVKTYDAKFLTSVINTLSGQKKRASITIIFPSLTLRPAFPV